MTRSSRHQGIWPLVVCWASVLVASAGAAPAELPPLRLGPKPTDSVVERKPYTQPTVPPGAKEIPFVETAPEPALTEQEKQRGYVLFQRPITEAVYPNTRPLAHERVESLVTFATPGQFQPVTFALYPVRPLTNLKVRISPLRCPAGEIPASQVDVRLGTYWNVGYPGYTTVNTYRRTPELLERVTVNSSPAHECQRYWLTIRVPDDAKGGLYQGTVHVWDDGFDQALEIPLALRVLPFRLQRDPAKHLSAYFYVRNSTLYRGRDAAFIRRAADNDYRAMVEFGLDMLPTLYLGCPDGKKIVLNNAAELERMLAAGLKGPAPVTLDNVVSRIYRDTTPGGKIGDHWQVNPLPGPKFYQAVAELVRAFEAQRKAQDWPQFVYCPIDEVDASCKEFGVKVYAAVKAAGAAVRTYATKDPLETGAADYAPHLDIWCSQPYSIHYERIVSQNRHEYWCYPNHNAGEIKDRRTMCKGGRTTYGFGFWRSGYTTLIPWNWCWTAGPDPFDYLRGRYSGCGQRVDDDGQVIPAVYWACFRAGFDDSRYIYTLQQAIVQREHSADSGCLAAIRDGRQVLQETWDAIRVQPRYLATGMWPSEEFDAARWRLAEQISRLLAFPAVDKPTAPSVLATVTATTRPAAEAPAPLETALREGKVETRELGDFAGWRNGTAEGKTEVTDEARRTGKTGLRWTVVIDHLHDGGEGGKYPVGWPRISLDFKPSQLDMTTYETLEFWLRVESSRDKTSAHRTPIGLVITSHQTKKAIYKTITDLAGPEGQWVPLRFSVKEMMATSEAEPGAWRSIGRVQLFICERDFADGTRLVFDLGEASLQRLTSPVIASVQAPRHVLLPRGALAIGFDVLGAGGVAKGSYVVTATLERAGVAVGAEARQDLAGPHWIALPLPKADPGAYTLRLTIRDAAGKQCSTWSQPVTMHAGTLY